MEHLLKKQVEIILDKILNNLARTKDQEYRKSKIIYRGSPNTFGVLPPSNNTYAMNENLFNIILSGIIHQYPNAYITTDKQILSSGRGGRLKSSFNRILINRDRSISIRVFLNLSEKVHEVLRPGIAFEEYFFSFISENLNDLKSLGLKTIGHPLLHRYNLTLKIESPGLLNKKILVENITGVKRVGQSNDKPDIEIICRGINRIPKPKVKISLKQANFGFWSSANRYTEAFNILEGAINSGKVEVITNPSGLSIFSGGISGIYVPATKDEISKYCFGEGVNRVDYIVIGGRYQGMDEFRVMNVVCDKFYQYSQTDINKLHTDKEVYLLISQDPSKKASGLVGPNGKRYQGFDIRFVNQSNITENSGRYIQVPRRYI